MLYPSELQPPDVILFILSGFPRIASNFDAPRRRSHILVREGRIAPRPQVVKDCAIRKP
jgi:hypothetical protein